MNDHPLEVKLVDQVRSCRTCKWFWGTIPPYGNFPVYDWKENFPEAIRNQQQTTSQVVEKPVLRGQACGQAQIDPGVMHGCRKAPIMTIGINPNMTAYFPSRSGALWSYPKFSNNARYAYYYRHHNVYQESLDSGFIEKNILDGTKLVAEQDGWLLKSERSSDHRWMLLTILYVGQDVPMEIEMDWGVDDRFVVLKNRSYASERSPHMRRIVFDNIEYTVDTSKLSFRKGDIIGGKIAGLINDDVQIYENSTGYYQRYVQVLERFKELVDGPLKYAPLSISEDVAQHDLIACASPGWSSAYDIPRNKITKSCVTDNAWLLSQLVQSKPAVIVIVGESSFAMFISIFAPFLKDFNYQYPTAADKNGLIIKETYQLLRETTERKKFLHIKVGNFELKSRIVISPHFSYQDNFIRHSRLTDSAWDAFLTEFPEDYAVLVESRRIRENTWNNVIPIIIDGPDDEIKNKMSTSAWRVLMAYYVDPIKMLAEVLVQELEDDRLQYDEKINRLKRNEGSCQFCVNNLWTFPEGCAYDKNLEQPPKEGELERVVKDIIQICKNADHSEV